MTTAAGAVTILLAVLTGWVLLRSDIAWTFSLAIAASMFSGNAFRIGFPIGPDRILFAFGVAILSWRALNARRTRQAPVFPPVRGVHWLLLVLAVYTGTSALWHHELLSAEGFYALLDRLGIAPFLVFYLAPVVFGTPQQRAVLLRVLVVVGAYLAGISFLTSLNLDRFVFPRYIVDHSIGITADRARGPFLQSAANGLAMISCAVAAVVAALDEDRPRARLALIAVALACELGTILTLTRSIWIAAILSAVVGAMMSRSLRRFAVPGLVGLAIAAGGIFVAVPGLSQHAGDRAQTEGPVWDRLNTNAAALRAAGSNPLFGIGWNRFVSDGPIYLRQADDYPLTDTSVGLPVHNVPLSYLAELGIVGFALWVAAMFSTLAVPVLSDVPRPLDAWRAGAGSLLVSWLVVANLTPLGYAFPLLVLFAWAGALDAGVRASWPTVAEGREALRQRLRAAAYSSTE